MYHHQKHDAEHVGTRRNTSEYPISDAKSSLSSSPQEVPPVMYRYGTPRLRGILESKEHNQNSRQSQEGLSSASNTFPKTSSLIQPTPVSQTPNSNTFPKTSSLIIRQSPKSHVSQTPNLSVPQFPNFPTFQNTNCPSASTRFGHSSCPIISSLSGF
jgi:hypothetical protein